jgi:FkbM family methyltransferase
MNLVKALADKAKMSKSQYMQDLVALWVKEKVAPHTQGFFVEFGAADGLIGSNSFLLEREFGWNGVLAEPAKVFHKKLDANRSCKIVKKAVSARSGDFLTFVEQEESCLSAIQKKGDLYQQEKGEKIYKIETISLLDLLESNLAPKEIDLLSIDTEGTEFEIIQNFPFNLYNFHLIVIEHNFRQDRDQIFNLLTANGYQRIMKSATRQDDFYVSANLVI